MLLSKSDYLLYKQCKKSLWLKKHNPTVMLKEEERSKLDKGNEVTEVARNIFPDGKLVSYGKIEAMIEETKRLIESGVTTIYEAAFANRNAVVICDILNFHAGAWNIYEVKSSTGMKERYVDDITYQHYVLKNNIKINSVNIVHINNIYVRHGNLDVNELFKIVDVTKKTTEKLSIIPDEINEMEKIIQSDGVVHDIGVFCNKYGKDDFECPAKEFCWSHIPEYSVFDITRIGKKAFDLYKEGYILLDEIPDNYKLSEPQRFQVSAYKEQTQILEREKIKEFLSSFVPKLYFLDFETFQQNIPLFDGIKPYQQIPFQYSLHVRTENTEELVHKEFLGKEGTDPRRSLAEHLITDIPMDVTSVAYNMSFEKMVLRDLANQFPDLSKHLMNIHDNMVDLMVPFQKKWYYLNSMRGSYSIKYVLPSLLPNDPSLDYKKLTIQNGSMAMETYARLHLEEKKKIQKIRQNLLAYCKLDTLAMVKIFEILEQL